MFHKVGKDLGHSASGSVEESIAKLESELDEQNYLTLMLVVQEMRHQARMKTREALLKPITPVTAGDQGDP